MNPLALPLTVDEDATFGVYGFKTPEEATAFIEGVEAATGWMESQVVETWEEED